MIRRAAALLIALTLAACGAPEGPAVTDPWVRLPAVEGRPAAAYFRFRAGQEAETLVSISTPIAGRTELHESMKMDGGAMSMKPMDRVAIAASKEVRFEPGGKHVMLFDVNPTTKPGATAPLTLRFADGGTIDVQAKLVGAGDPAPTQ